MPILLHWIKVTSITYIAVTREYKASPGMIKLVRGLGMRCLKVTQARGLCMNVNYTLEIIILYLYM